MPYLLSIHSRRTPSDSEPSTRRTYSDRQMDRRTDEWRTCSGCGRPRLPACGHRVWGRGYGICKPPTQTLRAHSEVTGSTSPTKLASRSRHLRSANFQCLTAVGSFSCQDQYRRLLKIRSLYKFTYLLTMRGSLGRMLSLTLRSGTPNIQ